MGRVGLFQAKKQEVRGRRAHIFADVSPETIFALNLFDVYFHFFFSLAHVPSAKTERRDLRAAPEPASIKMSWLHFIEAVMLSVFIYVDALMSFESAEHKLLQRRGGRLCFLH